MITGITKNKHGFANYTYVPGVLAAPKLVGFQKDTTAAIFAMRWVATVLGYTLLTDAKWGAVKLIPYKTHAALDLIPGRITLSAPQLLRIS